MKIHRWYTSKYIDDILKISDGFICFSLILGSEKVFDKLFVEFV